MKPSTAGQHSGVFEGLSDHQSQVEVRGQSTLSGTHREDFPQERRPTHDLTERSGKGKACDKIGRNAK